MGQDRPKSGGSNVFHPNHSKFRSCCCHVKTFTIGFGIVEIFIICFLLVAVVPDLNSNVCEENSSSNSTNRIATTTSASWWSQNGPNSTTTTMPSLTDIGVSMLPIKNEGMSTLHQLSCKFSVLWLVWAIVQIIAINLMFYGIKNNKWLLFIPHIALRACCALIFVALLVLLIIAFITYIQNGNGIKVAILAFILVGFGILVFWLYVMKCQVRCCQFVKKSAETGFSISNTRPVGTHTLSMSEPPRQAAQTNVPSAPPGTVAAGISAADGMGQVNSLEDGTRPKPTGNGRELPPLRHTYRPQIPR